MTDLVVGPIKSLIRIYAQVRKELIQVRRRPGAFFSLVLGPFIIMALFGLGYTGVNRALDTAIVIPQGLSLPSDPAYYQNLVGPAVNVKYVSQTPDQPLADLAAQKLDFVIAAPADATTKFQSGQQATIQVSINSVDPVAANYAGFIAQVMNQKVNEEIIKQAVTQGQGYAIAGSLGQAAQIPPEVVAAPTTVTVNNVAPSQPSVIGFAAPAALALMLQHMAVTLTALSFVRERLSGAMEMFRVSPVNSLELVLGKYLGLGLVSAVIAAISGALLVTVLGVPMLGSPLARRRRHCADRALEPGSRADHLGHLRLRAPGRSARPAAAARIGLLQRLRAAGQPVPAGRPVPRLSAPGHARDPAAAGLHAARRHDRVLAARRAGPADAYLPVRYRHPSATAVEERFRERACAADASGSDFSARHSRSTA